ncbi:MAG: endonuclease [Calditrichaeota bacterium]|nr:MAG: endonuclease [Calditrichota bacterium]
MVNKAITVVRALLGESTSVTRDEIGKIVSQILNLEMFRNLDKEILIREIESIYSVRVEDYRVIENSERRRPWVDAKRADIEWKFWKRYKEYLQDEKQFAPDVIDKLDRLTDKILDGLFDPTENIKIDKKGLVVGQVQSGKTSNYIGLICKAADAGFKMIIVLAGIHNNLRSQTQLRIDEGFLGFDTQYDRAFGNDNFWIGVGKNGKNQIIAHSLTSSHEQGDFTVGAANAIGLNFNTNEPIIAVVKKNAVVLRRLYKWLFSQSVKDESGQRLIHGKPLLVIDDEADNASINVSNDPEKRTAINGWIVKILKLFRKSAYVGYTATPFANIFIPLDEDDLFPRDFIVNIPPPSNYIGPEKVFGFGLDKDEEEPGSVLPIVKQIDDYQNFVPDKHKKDDPLPPSLPESLKLAIRCFIITCAVRRLRGQINVHNSMLIHVSRFQRWQDHVTELVQKQLDYYRRAIDQNDREVIELFRKTYEEDTDNYKSYVSISEEIIHSSLGDADGNIQVHQWKDVLDHLYDAVSCIKVKAIHGGSGDVLNYYDNKNGLSVIAVGGNKLSRGLTLEGLSVSYFLRASRMYDTLMQMGRWFGYRHGYVDLCRLFTSQELNEWYCHITRASEELRQEFDYMSDIAGSTPEQYALRVRTHPGVLQITASNKLRNAVQIPIQITWSGRLAESYEFLKDPQIMADNLRAAREFIESLPVNYSQKGKGFLWYDIPAELIIDFLEDLQVIENLRAYDTRNLVKFIRKQVRENNELTSWRVALMSKRNTESLIEFQIGGEPALIGCFLRRYDDKNSDDKVYYLKRSHLISPKDEFIDLSQEEYEKAMDLTKEWWKKKNKEGEPAYPNGTIVRSKIRNPATPLLLIYLLDPEGANLPKGSDPFVGFAISFPRSTHESRAYLTYAVNSQLIDKYNIDYDDEEY